MSTVGRLCHLCPRECGVDRDKTLGYCQSGNRLKVAKAMLHKWEEPCISGEKGSGAIFFSGCSLRCVFCQNYEISDKNFGKEITCGQLADIMLRLQDNGAHNINLVNPTHFIDKIIDTLEIVKDRLKIPVVYNCGGYEKSETIKRLKGYIDIYLPDFKYFSPEISQKYSGAKDYFDAASAAIYEMITQTNGLEYRGGMLEKGVIIRHLVLPMCYRDSIEIIEYIAHNYPKDKFLMSIMSQYTPMYRAAEYKEINRRITTYEYSTVCKAAEELEINGFFQKRSSAKEEYTPKFDLSGI